MTSCYDCGATQIERSEPYDRHNVHAGHQIGLNYLWLIRAMRRELQWISTCDRPIRLTERLRGHGFLIVSAGDCGPFVVVLMMIHRGNDGTDENETEGV